MSFLNYAKIFANSIFFMQTPLSNDAGTKIEFIFIYPL